jgi:hypothetical protein
MLEQRIAEEEKDLAVADMLQIQRRGRRNAYAVNPEARFRHPTLAPIPLRRIIAALILELVSGEIHPPKGMLRWNLPMNGLHHRKRNHHDAYTTNHGCRCYFGTWEA